MPQLRRLKLGALILASLVPNAAAQGQVVLPAVLAGLEGVDDNAFPFNCGVVSSMRYQQVFLGSEVGTGTISALRFRLNGGSNCETGFDPLVISNVTVQLSSTMTAHPFGPSGGLGSTFAENIGPDVTTVFAGDLVLSSSGSPSTPRPFDIVLPVRPRFFFDSSTGANLLLDISLPICPSRLCLDSSILTIDAHNGEDDGVARAAAVNHISPIADFADSLGLVTQILFLIFEDGFESGNTSAWSLTVP